MVDVLKVAKALELPVEYVTQTGGLLAVRGAGKSNAARVMAEEMYHAGLPFCAIDPVGSWYGLRSGKEGTPSGGLDVFIFGGSHGDVSLNKDAGALVADVVVDQRLTCIVDLSGFENDKDKKKFLVDFSRRLYFKNKDPLHLFLEEADDYIPQDMSDADRPLIKAWEDIVRRGRSRGIGCTIITQRSAAINKKVFTQVENLFVLRTTGPQDIKAIAEWVKYHEVKEDLLESLSALDDGEAWVWSPHFMKVIKKFRFRMSSTYDSGATPKNYKGKTARKVATLRDVNIEKLKTQMASTLEKVKSEDPVALRDEVAKLRAELHNQQKELERAKLVPAVDVSAVKNALQVLDQSINTVRSDLIGIANAMAMSLGAIVTSPSAALHISHKAYETGRSSSKEPNLTNPRRAEDGRSGTPLVLAKLGPTAKALLGTLCSVHPKVLSFSGLSILSGYSSKSSGFVNAISSLRTTGFLSGSRDAMQATEAGIATYGPTTPMGTGAALADSWMMKLDPTPRAIMRVLADAYPAAKTKEFIAVHSGKSLTSSGFVNGLSTLHTLCLITKPAKGMFKLNEEFFYGE